MKVVTDLKPGQIIKMDDELHRVLIAERRAGTGKFASSVHLKALRLSNRAVYEKHFRVDEKVEEVELERVESQYLYNDGTHYYFMHPETYEQIPLPAEVIGNMTRFIKEGDAIPIEFYGDAPVSVALPEKVTLKVASTVESKGKHERDSTYKTAILENGVEILVPQFIKIGDSIIIDVESGKYLERAK